MRGMLAAGLLVGAVAGVPASAVGQADVYRAMGIRPEGVLSGTIVQARILPGSEKQTVAMVTYLTGKKEEGEAVGLRLAVFRREGETLRPLYERDFAAENKGFVGRGEIEIVDLDGDGRSELVATWDNARSKVVEERRGEVLILEGDVFAVAWAGAVAYDATKAAREVPPERRDRYVRKLDIRATLRTRGISLFWSKTLTHVAGERLPEPRTVQETFPLRAAVED